MSFTIPDMPNNSNHQTVNYSSINSNVTPAANPVVKGKLVTDKPELSQNIGKRLAMIFGKEAILNFGFYIAHDIILPEFRIFLNKALIHLVNDITGVNTNYTNANPYNNLYNNGGVYGNYSSIRWNSSGGQRINRLGNTMPYSGGRIIFDTKDEAESVLGALADLCENQAFLRFADVLNITGNGNNINATMYNRGWRNIAGFKVETTPEGFALVYPPMIGL